MRRPMQDMRAFRAVVEVIDRIGSRRTSESILADMDLSRAGLATPGAFVPYRLTASFAERAARRLGELHLGAIVGAFHRYADLGPYARYVLAAPDLAAALTRGARALPLLQTGSRVTLRAEEGHVVLGFESGLGTIVGARHVDEGMPLLLCDLLRAFLGASWRPGWVELPEAADVREGELESRYCGIEIRCGARAPAIAIKTADLGAPNPAGPAAGASPVLSDVRAMLRSRPPQNDTQVVRAMLRVCVRGGACSPEAVARQLGCGVRTLQRRLHVEGTTFRELHQRALAERARALLAEGELSVAEVATALGYEEVNAFRRAFRGWTGITPTRYARAAHRKLPKRALRPLQDPVVTVDDGT